MEGVRMLTVLVEQDSRKLGENTLLIPFEESWLGNNSCRQLLQFVLNAHLELPDVLVASQVKMYCMRQQESASGSGRNARKARGTS